MAQKCRCVLLCVGNDIGCELFEFRKPKRLRFAGHKCTFIRTLYIYIYRTVTETKRIEYDTKKTNKKMAVKLFRVQLKP